MPNQMPIELLDPAGGTPGQVPTINAAGDAVEYATPGTGPGGGAIAVDDEGAEVVAAASRLNFTGAGVTVTDSGSGEVQVAIPGGGGGGGGWATALDLPLTTAAGFTAVGGSWAADANGLRQSSTAAAPYRELYTAAGGAVSLTEVVAQVELRVNAAPATGHVGLLLGYPRTTAINGTMMGGFNVSAGGAMPSAYAEADNQVGLGSMALASPIAAGTWVTLRLVRFGTMFDHYVDGTLISSFRVSYDMGEPQRYVGLKSYGVDVTFRNLKAWTRADLPA